MNDLLCKYSPLTVFSLLSRKCCAWIQAGELLQGVLLSTSTSGMSDSHHNYHPTTLSSYLKEMSIFLLHA